MSFPVNSIVHYIGTNSRIIDDLSGKNLKVIQEWRGRICVEILNDPHSMYQWFYPGELEITV